MGYNKGGKISFDHSLKCLNGGIKHAFLFFIISWLFSSISTAQNIEQGTPFIQNFTPRDYNAHSQTWGITQASNGVMYIGNGNGILEFDGEFWNLIRTPNISMVRHITEGPDKRLYAGVNGDIGYLSPDSLGQMTYHSLMDYVPEEWREFDDVWNTRSTSRNVYFQTYFAVYEWNGDSIKVHKPEHAYHRIYEIRDTIYATHQHSGILKLEDGSFNQIPGGEFYGNEPIFFMLPFGENGFIASSFEGPVYTYQNGEFSEFPTEADSLFKIAGINDGTVLPNGDISIATLQEGVIVINPEGELKAHLKEEEGLISFHTNHVFADRDGGLWISGNQGISRAEMNSPFRTFDKRTGFDNIVEAITRHEGKIYVSTLNGVYSLNEQQGTDRFELVPSLTLNAFALQSSAAANQLLVGANDGIFNLKSDNKVERIFSYGIHEIVPSKFEENKMLLGATQGFASMTWQEDSWSFEDYFDIVGQEIRVIIEQNKDTLWLGTLANGVFLASRSAGADIDTAVHFPSLHSTHSGGALPYIIDGIPRFLTETGVFMFDASQQTFRPDSIFGNEYAGGKGTPIWTLNWITEDTIYASAGRQPNNRIIRFIKTGEGYQPDKESFSRLPEIPYWRIFTEQNGSVWFGSIDRLITYDSSLPDYIQPPFNTLIRDIRIEQDSLIIDKLNSNKSPRLNYPVENIRFNFSAPSFDNTNNNQYRFRLVGFEKEWSPWSTRSFRDYTNLSEGAYTFEVQSKNSHRKLGEKAVVHFSIYPPWYRAGWFNALKWVAVAFAFFAFVRYVSLRKLIRKVELLEWREKVQKERERISRDLHDNIGTQLSNFISGLEISKQYLKSDEKDQAASVLDTLDKDARVVISELRETIWALHQDEVTLEDFISHIKSFLNNHLKYHDTLKLSISNKTSRAIQLNSKQSLHLLRIIQEIFTNTLKYAEAEHFSITFRLKTEKELKLLIEDDGKGFEMETNTDNGYGINNVKKRVEELNGKVSVSANPGEGVSYQISLPI